VRSRLNGKVSLFLPIGVGVEGGGDEVRDVIAGDDALSVA